GALMRPQASDPIQISDNFWMRSDVEATLDGHDIGALFRLVRRHTGASQTRIGIAVGMPQSRVSAVMAGDRVTTVEVLTRIADGLDLPTDARRRLGLAAQANIQVAEHDPWNLVQALTHSTISAEMVDRFERVAVSHAGRYPSTPPERMWPTIQVE